MPALTCPDTPVPSATAPDIRSVCLGVNPRKVTSPDRVPSLALRSCVDHLVKVSADILNFSLLQIEVLTCFQKTTVIPVPKKAHTMYLNDYHPVALTSIIMMCFERLIMAHINSSLPACLDPYNLLIELPDPQATISEDRKKGGEHAPIYFNENKVERVETIKLIGDHKKLQKLVCAAQTITEANLPSVGSIYMARCHRKAVNIIEDSGNDLLQLLPLGRRYRSLNTCTSSFRNNFFP
eukprot:g46002.t1